MFNGILPCIKCTIYRLISCDIWLWSVFHVFLAYTVYYPCIACDYIPSHNREFNYLFNHYWIKGTTMSLRMQKFYSVRCSCTCTCNNLNLLSYVDFGLHVTLPFSCTVVPYYSYAVFKNTDGNVKLRFDLKFRKNYLRKWKCVSRRYLWNVYFLTGW